MAAHRVKVDEERIKLRIDQTFRKIYQLMRELQGIGSTKIPLRISGAGP